MPPLEGYAPGRLEILGNHTDYNEGVVLACAISMGVTVRGEPRAEPIASLRSEEMGTAIEVNLDSGPLQALADRHWANYPIGVIEHLRRTGVDLPGFSADISATLPVGAGLSSSAAVLVATAKFLLKLSGRSMEPMALARFCRQVENEFVGVPCGLLDQASSVFGKANHLVLLDCRTETVEQIPFPESLALLVTHSGVAHAMGGGEYAERREQCFEAARILGVPALRDADAAMLEAARGTMSDVVFRRATHIIGENARVLQGLALLREGDDAGFGRLMWSSHESSRVCFENSTPELDRLVELTRHIPGILGSRLTGGGFGGATVSLVRKDSAQAARDRLLADYRAATGISTRAWICAIADGAH